MPSCSLCNTQLVNLPFCMDRDGIRPAKVCTKCNTAYRSTSSGLCEFTREEYNEHDMHWPEHIRLEEENEFHTRALARGYVKLPKENT